MPCNKHALLAIAGALLLCHASAKVFDYEVDGGALAEDDSWDTVLANGAALNASLAALSPGDVFVVPNKTCYLMGGIVARDLASVTIQIDGTLEFASTTLRAQQYLRAWPRTGDGVDASVLECMHFTNLSDVLFTSSGEGKLDGVGAKWWGVPGVGYLGASPPCRDVLRARAIGVIPPLRPQPVRTPMGFDRVVPIASSTSPFLLASFCGSAATIGEVCRDIASRATHALSSSTSSMWRRRARGGSFPSARREPAAAAQDLRLGRRDARAAVPQGLAVLDVPWRGHHEPRGAPSETPSPARFDDDGAPNDQ